MAEMLKFDKIINGFQISIAVSSNFSEALMEVIPTAIATEDSFPNKEQLEQALKENGIILGIKEDVLNSIANGRMSNMQVLVAEQLQSQDGRDSEIKYLFEKDDDSLLTQDEHGNINFKELNWFKQVKVGDVLAEKIPFTMGIDGYNIKGIKVQGKPGKDRAFKYGANVEVEAGDLRLIATKAGRYENIDGKISVNDVLDINSDVDTSVGNVEFDGDVVVKKDVKAGFAIKCEGSLEVGGVIEASNIDVKGDLVVKGGIKGGENAKITVGGSLVCKFIENANVKVFGNIGTEFIIHSRVASGGKITVEGRKSLISGGEVQARDLITVNTLGSHMATKTNIILGVDIEKSEKLEESKGMIEFYEKEIEKLIQQIASGKELMQRGKMDMIKKIEFTKTLKQYSSYQEKVKEINATMDKIESELREFKFSSIKVKDCIYPGVRITIIENSKYFVDQEGSCKVVLENGEVSVKK